MHTGMARETTTLSGIDKALSPTLLSEKKRAYALFSPVTSVPNRKCHLFLYLQNISYQANKRGYIPSAGNVPPKRISLYVQRRGNVVGEQLSRTQPLRHEIGQGITPLGNGIQPNIRFERRSNPPPDLPLPGETNPFAASGERAPPPIIRQRT